MAGVSVDQLFDSWWDKTNSTCFQIHIPLASAWSHVVRVEENAFATT
jgi:hypothetical protein